MAYARTFAQLSLAVQQLGQWEASDDVTPDVLLQAVNYGLLEGYDLMVEKWADYYTTSATFAIVAGTDTYALATIAPNFYKHRHLAVSTDGTKFLPCLPHELDAAWQWSGLSNTDVRRVRYRLQGASLIFAPVPSAGTGRIYYIPLAPQIASTADTTPITFDVPTEERLVVQLAQHDILERNDLSTADCDRKVERLAARLRTSADNRDAGEPFTLDPRGPRRSTRLSVIDEDTV